MALKDIDVKDTVFKLAIIVGTIVVLEALNLLEFGITIGSGL